MALPQEYQNLLNAYKQRLQTEELPVAERALAASQARRGIFSSPVATRGLVDLQNKFLSAIGGKEAELGVQSAEAAQQERMRQSEISSQETQQGRALEAQRYQNELNRNFAAQQATTEFERQRQLQREASRKARKSGWSSLLGKFLGAGIGAATGGIIPGITAGEGLLAGFGG